MSTKSKLVASLKRAEVRHAKKVANFLLRQGYAWHKRGEAGGLWLTRETCPFKDTLYPPSQLQTDLIQGGFLIRADTTGPARNQFLPGPKLIRYLAEVAEEKGDVVQSFAAETRLLEHDARIRSLEAEVKEHSKQLSDLKQAIDDIHLFNPPVTPDKIAERLKLVVG